MKKYLRSILCLLLALCMVMCFVACDKDKDEDKDEEKDEKTSEEGKSEKKEEAKGPSGTYYIFEMTMEGETIDRDTIEEMGADYKDIYITFNSDGTGELCSVDATSEFEWEGTTITVEDEEVEFSLNGNTITLADEDAEMIFKK